MAPSRTIPVRPRGWGPWVSGGLLLLAGLRLLGDVPAEPGTVLAWTAFWTLAALAGLELLGGSADPDGGTHPLTDEVLGGLAGFLSGWALFLGGLALSVALARSAALLLPGPDPRVGALGILAAWTFLHLGTAWPRPTFLWPLPLLLWLASLRLPAPALTGIGAFAFGYAPFEWLLSARGRARTSPRAALAPLGGLVLALLLTLLLPRPQGTGEEGRIAAGLLALAAAAALRLTDRTLYALLRRRGRGAVLLRVPGPLKAPPGLLGLRLLLAALLVLLPPEGIAGVAAVGFWLPPLLLCAALWRSLRREPRRRRPLRLPFPPLFPALGLFLGLALGIGIPQEALLWGGGGLLAGLALGLTLLRRGLAEEVLPGEGLALPPKEGRRILLPVEDAAALRRALPLVRALLAQGGDLVVLRVIPVPDPLAAVEMSRRLRDQADLFRWSVADRTAGLPVHILVRPDLSPAEGILEAALEVEADLILLPWSPSGPGRAVETVVRHAARPVAVLSPGREAPSEAVPARLLLPTAGGPNVSLALDLALTLLKEGQGRLTLLYVRRPGEEEAPRPWLEAALEGARRRAAAAGIEPARIDLQIVSAPDPAEGILRAAAGYDLVLLGASEESLLDQVLFGSVPQEVARRSPSPTLIVRRAEAGPRRWLHRLWAGLTVSLPKLTPEEQREVYRQLRRGARADVDFFVMIGLAALIAAFGLLQDSGAVVIGAMLVAPLFTPILALSLGVAAGDARLLRVAAEAALKGVLLAVSLSFLLAWIVPIHALTGQILARTHPNLVDLGIALTSGAAGAYAVARREVSAALPGVAIAVALIPPLAVLGIGLAWGGREVALGAALLFSANLGGIVLVGALVFLLLGIRPPPRAGRTHRLRRGLVLTLLFLLLVSLPLAWGSIQAVARWRLEQAVRAALPPVLAPAEGTSLRELEVERRGGEVEVTAVLYVRTELPPGLERRLREALERRLGEPVRLRLILWSVREEGP